VRLKKEGGGRCSGKEHKGEWEEREREREREKENLLLFLKY